MTASDTTAAIIPAIHAVQQAVDPIEQTGKADTGKFSYRYATLPHIWTTIRDELAKNELTVVQSPTGGVGGMIGDFLTTTIYHSSGEWISDSMRLVITREDPQGMGAAITYARRYALSAMLGLVTDSDTDAVTQRLADGEMKRDWVRAFTVVSKKINPDSVPTNNDFVKFMEEVYGKHPSRILAREHQQVLDTINAFNP